MQITINGTRALASASLCFPLRGVWHLIGDLIDAAPLEGRVTVEGPGLALVGTVQRSGATRGATSVRILGGAGRLGEGLPAASYRRASVRTLLGEILDAVGERLSARSTPAVLDRLRVHARRAGPAIDALATLADLEAATWRVLDDGTIFFGLETWPAAPSLGLGTVTPSEDPTGGRSTLAPELATLRPGTLLGASKVAFVEYSLSPSAVRAVVEFQTADGAGDRLETAFSRIVQHEIRQLGYLGTFEAEVLRQRDDGTLDLRPIGKRRPDGTTDKAFAGIERVRVLYGLPDSSARVKKGQRGVFTFPDGDPSRAALLAWANGTEADEITLLETGGSTPKAVVREGDVITVGDQTGPVAITGTKSKVKAG